jgi:hypothetical protein
MPRLSPAVPSMVISVRLSSDSRCRYWLQVEGLQGNAAVAQHRWRHLVIYSVGRQTFTTVYLHGLVLGRGIGSICVCSHFSKRIEIESANARSAPTRRNSMLPFSDTTFLYLLRAEQLSNLLWRLTGSGDDVLLLHCR